MRAVRVLVVEDEPATLEALRRGLQGAGFQVDAAKDGEDALGFLQACTYQAVILDRRLPGRSGDEVLAWLRRRADPVPVLMLTALDRVSERVQGLEAGADDYLVKPFAFEELLARLRSLLRRAGGAQRPARGFGDFLLDGQELAVRCGPRTVLLTPREFDLLEALVRAGGRPLSAKALMDAAWPEPWEASEEALWVHMKNLRHKLRAAGSRATITSRRQVGYRLEEAGPDPPPQPGPPEAAGPKGAVTP